MPTAQGSFEVKLTPQTASAEMQAANLGRMSIDKHFHGDLEAVSQGEMLSCITDVDGSAGYVAIERVTGMLQGRSGSFALQHNGIMARGAARLIIEVVPDTGSDELAGLSGSLTIDIREGRHFYALHYTLPGVFDQAVG
ncbi:MAG: DUF3224 domain-containing protein [Caldilineales bacterium]